MNQLVGPGALDQLAGQGAKGLVLDLRGNGGGIVDHAVRIAGLFLPRGADIALQKERGADDTEYTNADRPLAPDLPLVVLIDGGSASASEIVAGALQDHDRAVVLGTTSFGKGLVQTAYRVDGGPWQQLAPIPVDHAQPIVVREIQAVITSQ